MSDPKDSDAPCVLHPIDTPLFGFTVAAVNSDVLTRAGAADIDHWCARERVRLLYLLARSDDVETTVSAAEAGFLLTDVRLTLARDFSSTGGIRPPEPAEASDFTIRPGRRDDADADAVARALHGAFRASRYYHDPRIPTTAADRLFDDWMRRSFRSAAHLFGVWVAEDAGGPIGFVTATRDRIPLLGVAPSARGRGVGQELISTAVQWAQKWNAPTIQVDTQARNSAAVRLYERCGFRLQQARLHYHKWYDREGQANG